MSIVFLEGLALRNYRGIGDEFVRMAPFQGVNFFIGPNNAGKSTVLHFLRNYLRPDDAVRHRESWRRELKQIDVRLGKLAESTEFAIPITKTDLIEDTFERAKNYRAEIEAVVSALARDNHVWLKPHEGKQKLEFIDVPDGFQKTLNPHAWNHLWVALVRGSGGDVAGWVAGVLGAMQSLAARTWPNVQFIPAIRQISEAGAAFDDFSGKGLIDRLAALQNPGPFERANFAKFESINEFLRDVTDSRDARIEVPHDRKQLMVHMDDKVLPLDSLGTGIHEVIMLASFCTLTEDQIVCIEEPEIHLHPLLQRKLMRYLDKQTTNQYFVATHSASIMDSVSGSIFGVEKRDGITNVSLAAAAGDRYEICKRLGYHASDILQSNSVIWVEGPSDRIYLNHWIAALDPDLVEGIDYSIMFYGGRLLSHLTANDPDVSEFISLRKLNRNLAVVIDSDKDAATSRVNKTKTRVLAEVGPNACWVTAGREIENYVPTALISAALKQIYGQRFTAIARPDKYGHRLHFSDTKTKKLYLDADKVKVAQYVASQPADLTELDLRKRMSALVGMIRAANPNRS